jgi:hypothetical protein
MLLESQIVNDEVVAAPQIGILEETEEVRFDVKFLPAESAAVIQLRQGFDGQESTMAERHAEEK